MRHSHGLRAAAGIGGFDFLDPNNIGLAVEGGFFAGLISHTADGVATHALIVAPRATGATGTGYTLTTNKEWKTLNTTTSGTTSFYDGAVNTAAMVADDITIHPAAEFCVNLNIGGYSDWYMPAELELDIAYANLKPTTDSNSTSWGINAYSVPKRTVNFTAGSPAQTSVAAFQIGGGEDFEDAGHWSSSERNSLTAWRLYFNNGGRVNTFSKTSTERVRAFRKIAL